MTMEIYMKEVLVPGNVTYQFRIIHSRTDIVYLLELFQEFKTDDDSWLPQMATLCNEGETLTINRCKNQ